MKTTIEKARRRRKRKLRIRGRIKGTAGRPRITVYRSNRNLYVQAIDDANGVTLAAASSVTAEMRELRPTVADAVRVGEAIGARLKEKGISEVVFDRNGYLYHGVVKSLADGARKAGLKF